MIQLSTTTPYSSVAFLETWDVLAIGDEGSPLTCAQYADKTMQVAGTFGGATVSLLGSNNGVDWAVLHDTMGAVITVATAKHTLVADSCVYVKPVINGGDGTTALVVTILMKG